MQQSEIMKDVTLESLLGLHILSGVDRNHENIPDTYGDGFANCQVFNFCLDGKTYTACEDPDDGYRSCMRYLRESELPIMNAFAGVQVLGTMMAKGTYDNEVLQLIDCKTGKIVLEVGTSDSSDYYPCFVSSFSPENMAINAT